ncbi:hypothetical protein AWB79_03607 [Caballeronia hypogeia]|uniref:Uncharacterized protein n=1 Tax=Caballeronia hypogeia TaxID=1777140 RepID=A0A158BFC1_9BURK|nr:hypothetical protein AWB79_03607 [Caballeronia hypogeia]
MRISHAEVAFVAASEPKTLKERLGDKASDAPKEVPLGDEPCVDNCKVPAEQRGTKVRPDTCAR